MNDGRLTMRVMLEAVEMDPPKRVMAHFIVRTNRHVALVRKYCELLEEAVPGLVERGEVHDMSKFEAPELVPYAWLTWRYKCKDDGVAFEGPEGVAAAIDRATEHHILENAHHPEAHQGKKSGLLNTSDRDKPPEEMVDATKMPDLDLGEMVADWCAMSEERGNTPREWADKNVNIRWTFTAAQKRRIYELIDLAWGTNRT